MQKLGIVILLTMVVIAASYFVISRKGRIMVPPATPAPTTVPSASPTPSASPVSLKELIIQALAKKNNWDASQVELNVSKTEGDYAKGDVRFKGEMGGGLWFAAKVGGEWKIVYDGNGIITCDMLTAYKAFPKDMIPECYNTTTEKMQTR